jgi:dihydroorotate dehydrogenase
MNARMNVRMSERSWPCRLGLAGGIDKDGSRAAALLAAGFDSVEFGTVTPRPEEGGNPGLAALVSRLAALASCPTGKPQIGIGIGMGSDVPPSALPDEWAAGFRGARDVADYVCFNLSARRYRPLFDAANLPLLRQAFETVAAVRQAEQGRHAALVLKMELGARDAFPITLAEAAVADGVDAIVAVLPEDDRRLDRLRLLAGRLRGKAGLVAVGGIRNAGDAQAAYAAGADGVQVHRIFAELGAACLPALRRGEKPGRPASDGSCCRGAQVGFSRTC